jgi:integrase
MMNLSDVLDRYLATRRLSDGAAYQMRRTLCLFPGSTTADLTDTTVSAWLVGLEPLYAGWTLSGHRTRILCLWRFAARHGWAVGPGEVRRETPPPPMPTAWTVDEIGRLAAAAALVAHGDYWHALILAGYETGLRRSDLWGLRRDQIATTGLVALRQHKTGQPHEPLMRPETAAEVLALPGDYPLASPWGPRAFYQRFALIRLLAGVSSDGGLQQLRRTGATAVACAQGLDAARQFLGHRTAGMVNFYVDRSQYRPRGVLPPRLG